MTTHAPVLQIDVLRRTVRLRGVDLELARREFDLLLHLARHPGRIFRRDALLAEVWGTSEPTATRTVDVHIRRLRSKFGTDDRLISTVRHVGYRIAPDADVTVTE